MERRGQVESEWGLSENNRPAKYYGLTPGGRRRLRSETATMRRYAEALSRMLEADRA
jgi:DNA-binding PadR family transcriptional regulator